jgi:hypothetical protein
MPFGIDLFSSPAPAARRPVLDMGGPESACAQVRLALRMGPALDTVSCRLATSRSELAAGDGLTVAMGYEDSGVEDLFTGTVSSVSANIHGQTIVIAGNGGEALARLRINQSFVDMSSGDIIADLAGRAGVDAAEIVDGPDLPLYVADDRSHLLDHIATLAGFSGADVTFDAGGGLVCALSGETPPAVTFVYGASIAAGRLQQSVSLETPLQSTGEGAAGSDGDDAWPWIIADSGSTASGDAGGRVVSVGALRSADAVSGFHGAWVAKRARMTGAVLIDAPGTPILRPGYVFTVEHDALGGEYVAAEVIHSYSKAAGFLTRVHGWRKGGSGGLPGGLL